MKQTRILTGFAVIMLAGCAGASDTTPDTGTSTSLAGNKPAVIAENLQVPWSVVFLPNNDILLTQRPGTLLRMSGPEQKQYVIEGVQHRGEGGLLGVALHPDFAKNNWLYLYLTTDDDNGTTNRVERYTFGNDALTGRKVILENIPGAANHDGGRIAFGPDKKLYITTGDAGTEDNAQDKNSLAGKILRLDDDGTVPSDNPFGNAVYSYGHRNPQGLTWDDSGQLWSTEHGRSGVQSGYDELNKIHKGANYGWPLIQGDETQEGMESPVLHSGSDDTWAPASATYLNGSIFFGGLRGETLYEAVLAPGKPELVQHFAGQYGRIRDTVVGPDGMLYFTTSNRDGRGSPAAEDDRLLRMTP